MLVYEKTEFVGNIEFSAHLFSQTRTQTFLEISASFFDD